MKCTECKGTGERETNIDGADCPVVCGFCEGTGVTDEESIRKVENLQNQAGAIQIAIDLIKYEIKSKYPITLIRLGFVKKDLENQIEEIRNRE